MRDLNQLRQRLLLLRELNPLWVLSLGVVVLAVAAGGLVQRHLHDSARLEDRLSGGALVDALRLYAEATEPGQPNRPGSLGELVDDNRGGRHRAWLDTASAAALADHDRWTPVRDGDGRLLGVQQRSGPASGALWSWLTGSRDEAPVPYLLQQTPVQVAAPAPPAAPEIVLPQPVMPVGGLPPLKLAGTLQPPAARDGQPVARLTPGATGAPSAAGAAPPPAVNAAGVTLKPSRILAGLEARQVLRLSGGADEPPLVVPRRTTPQPGSSANAAVTALKPVTPMPLPRVSQAQGAPLPPGAPARGAPSLLPVLAPPAPPAPPARALPVVQVPPAVADRFAPGLPFPLPPGVPLNVPLAPPAANGSRVDTVIYEEPPAPPAAATVPAMAGTAADSPAAGSVATAPANCRALAGDSTECDALDDGNSGGALYQRCYQSLSERINACLAGDPLPPLVTR